MRITGIDKTNLQSWCGLMADDFLLPFWTAFTEAKTNGSKTFVLNSFLTRVQCHNVHVQFTIQAAFIRDLKLRDFAHPRQVSTMNRGISPFSIQQLTAETIVELYQEADAATTATHISIQDACRQAKKGAAFIPTEPYTFLELLASFKALTHMLFGPASPLYLDAEELYEIGLDGHKYGNLQAIKLYQPDWFAHILWQVHVATQSYFDSALLLDQLKQGA